MDFSSLSFPSQPMGFKTQEKNPRTKSLKLLLNLRDLHKKSIHLQTFVKIISVISNSGAGPERGPALSHTGAAAGQSHAAPSFLPPRHLPTSHSRRQQCQCPHCEGRVEKNPGFFYIKISPVSFFVFFCFFFVFFWFFYVLAQQREFLGFFQFQEYFQVHPDFKL